MKRALIWVVGVAFGVCLFLAGVMGVSYQYTDESALPTDAVFFEDTQLVQNGSNWYVPLIGGVLDKQMQTTSTLSVQDVGIIEQSHPSFTVPSWATDSTLTLTNANGDVVFEGSLSEYESYDYTANGVYKASVSVWHLPSTQTMSEYSALRDDAVRRNTGLETPTQPSGWYAYSFKFDLQAAATITLSSSTAYQGDVVCLEIDGTYATTAPVIETDLGDVQALDDGDGWRVYIPITYNAESGVHVITITANGKIYETSLTVYAKTFATVELTTPAEDDVERIEEDAEESEGGEPADADADDSADLANISGAVSVNGQLIPTGTVSVQSAANTGNDADESDDAEVEDTTDTQTGNVTVTVDLAAANTEYRNIIWALYDDDATEKQWFGAWSFPVSNYSILIDYGARKWLDGAYDSQSNSVTLTTLEGDDVVAPAGGTVVYAGELLLTGNTIVIDHGFGVRSYLFGLSEIFVSEGDVVLQNQIIATASTQTVFDVKIGNKSISPWNLTSGKGGLFWNEYA